MSIVLSIIGCQSRPDLRMKNVQFFSIITLIDLIIVFCKRCPDQRDCQGLSITYYCILTSLIVSGLGVVGIQVDSEF